MAGWITAADLQRRDSAPVDARDAARCTHVVRIGVHGFLATIAFDDARAAATMAQRYALFPERGEPAVRMWCFGDGHSLTFNVENDAVWHWDDGPLRTHAVVMLADSYAMSALFRNPRCDLTAFHAAALRRGDAAIMIAGVTTAGKSTTALACTRRGFSLYSDERCVVRDGMVLAFPRAIGLRSGGLALLAGDAVGDPLGEQLRARGSEPWEDAPFTALFGANAVPQPAPLRVAIALEGHGATPQLSPISAYEFVRRAGGGVAAAGTGLDRVTALAALLRPARCFALRLGTPDASALAIAAALDPAVSPGAGA